MSYFAMLNVSVMTGLSRRVCFETFVRQISVRIRAHRLDRVDPVPTVVHRVHVVVDVEVVTVTVAVVVVVVPGIILDHSKHDFLSFVMPRLKKRQIKNFDFTKNNFENRNGYIL